MNNEAVKVYSEPGCECGGEEFEYADESGDTDEYEEGVVEDKLIERILIVRGLLEDHQAKEKAAHEASASEGEPTAGIFAADFVAVGAEFIIAPTPS